MRKTSLRDGMSITRARNSAKRKSGGRKNKRISEADSLREEILVATLERLKEQKRELEEKLYAGDVSVEPLLVRVDRAIAARTSKIQHSRKRLGAAKNAVDAGMSPDEARTRKTEADLKKMVKKRAKRPLNRFK